jgi:hypothetical protein
VGWIDRSRIPSHLTQERPQLIALEAIFAMVHPRTLNWIGISPKKRRPRDTLKLHSPCPCTEIQAHCLRTPPIYETSRMEKSRVNSVQKKRKPRRQWGNTDRRPLLAVLSPVKIVTSASLGSSQRIELFRKQCPVPDDEGRPVMRCGMSLGESVKPLEY